MKIMLYTQFVPFYDDCDTGNGLCKIMRYGARYN